MPDHEILYPIPVDLFIYCEYTIVKTRAINVMLLIRSYESSSEHIEGIVMPNRRWIVPVLYLALIGIHFHKEVASYVIEQYIPLLAGFIIVAAGLAIYLIPKLQIRGLPDDISSERRLELENKTRATLSQAISVVIFIVSILMIWTVMNNTKQIANNSPATDRFNRAVDLFNHPILENTSKWLGGLYALERTAADSPANQRAVLDILSAYVRKHASDLTIHPFGSRPPRDIQTIMAVIGRIKAQDSKAVYINLSNINLASAHLKGINLSGADMTNTVLNCARLDNADFSGADLSSADISGADLYGVNFNKANLTGTNLNGASMARTDWTLQPSNSAHANVIYGFTLNSANLNGANLSGASLERTDLSGVDLRGVIGLTQDQLSSAVTDNTTKVRSPLRVRDVEYQNRFFYKYVP